jgi:hypothetical protein
MLVEPVGNPMEVPRWDEELRREAAVDGGAD